MAVNLDKPGLWKADIAASVDFYNDWFIRFAPEAYRDTRAETTKSVELALRQTENLTSISPSVLSNSPAMLPTLRMSTAPPLARDRLIGLAGVSPGLVRNMELQNRVSPSMSKEALERELAMIGDLIIRLADRDIFPWLGGDSPPAASDAHRAATIVADRLCGAVADPIIRNAQEERQLAAIQAWLEKREYQYSPPGEGLKFDEMQPGTFGFRVNVPAALGGNSDKQVNIPVDVAVKPHGATDELLPLLIEAKSAGDCTNTNKRRKEEAQKVGQLRATYGDGVTYFLFLCGYFNSGYLGYEAAEGIDWVWEHRIDDLEQFGL